MTLPPGYGYPTNPADKWRALLMVMHHRAGEREFFLEYRVTVDPRPVIPVKPYWLSVIPCSPDPQWSVPGRRQRPAPALARVHDARGGPDRRRRRPPARRRARARPQPAGLRRPHARPLQAVLRARRTTRCTRSRRCCTSPTRRASAGGSRRPGWPIREGERLKVTAAYDDTRPHTRVMGIDHVYVAPPRAGRAGAALRARAARTREILGAEFAGARRTPPERRAHARRGSARTGARARARAGPARRATVARRREGRPSTTSRSARTNLDGRPPARSCAGASPSAASSTTSRSPPARSASARRGCRTAAATGAASPSPARTCCSAPCTRRTCRR